MSLGCAADSRGLTRADVLTGVRSARRRRSRMSFSCSDRLRRSIAVERRARVGRQQEECESRRQKRWLLRVLYPGFTSDHCTHRRPHQHAQTQSSPCPILESNTHSCSRIRRQPSKHEALAFPSVIVPILLCALEVLLSYDSVYDSGFVQRWGLLSAVLRARLFPQYAVPGAPYRFPSRRPVVIRDVADPPKPRR